MLRDLGVSVVIPAHNEELTIGRMISTLPEFIDVVVIVDDQSNDLTKMNALEACKMRGWSANNEVANTDTHYRIVEQPHGGPGRAVYTGFELIVEMDTSGELQSLVPEANDWSVVVMDADNQMDPDYLASLLECLMEDKVDFVKGDRSSHISGMRGMPLIRRIGSHLLTQLTRWASGYRTLNDPQCGYRAIRISMIKKMDLSNCWRGYGYPNHWLVESGKLGFRMGQVPVRCVYGDEISGMKIWKFMPSVSLLLLKGLWTRGWRWYVRGDGMSNYSRMKRLAVSMGWLGALASIGTLAFLPTHWFTLMVCAATGLLLADRVDAMESRRRLSESSTIPVGARTGIADNLAINANETMTSSR